MWSDRSIVSILILLVCMIPIIIVGCDTAFNSQKKFYVNQGDRVRINNLDVVGYIYRPRHWNSTIGVWYLDKFGVVQKVEVWDEKQLTIVSDTYPE